MNLQVENGIPYIEEKTKCSCPCHGISNIKHFAPCCDNGYNTFKRSVINTNLPKDIFQDICKLLIEKINPVG
jgi:hypothetical protein